jgi:hypothetical protein
MTARTSDREVTTMSVAWMPSRAAQTTLRLLLAVLMAMLLTSLPGGLAPAPARGATLATTPTAATPPNAGLPAATCTESSGTRSCGLWAKTGTLTLPAGSNPASVDMWGYADSASGDATVPGPLIVANVGETLEVTLHNDLGLGMPTSLAFPGQGLVPDTTGVADGASKTYTLDLTRAGTFRYEAGLTDLGPRQVAMGMQGVIVVRPGTAGQAYGDPSSTFDDEALAVISTVDPSFNAAPLTFSLDRYVARFHLINGKAFPETEPVYATAGDRVLLRYVNAGLEPVSMGLLGLHQTIVGQEGHAAAYPSDVVAETLPPGTTLDTVATLPATAAPGTQVPVLEETGRLDNDGAVSGSLAHGGIVDFGGALTFLSVTAGPAQTTGPVTTGVTVAPDPSDGATALTVDADISDALTGGDDVTAAELFVDSADGTGVAMTLSGAVGPERTASGTVPAGLSHGAHTVYVHGRDASGAWGALTSRTFHVDSTGPSTTFTLTPNPTGGTSPVAVAATGDDTGGAGGSDVVAAEMYVDSACVAGTATALTREGAAGPTSSFTGSIASGLTEGSHTVRVRSRDALGNWGACADRQLVVDKTGPVVSGQVALPNPASGSQSVTLSASATDPSVATPASNVAAAEWYEGTDPGTGNGHAMVATDGAFDSATEAIRAVLNASTFSAGTHTLRIRAEDAAGNWGAPVNASLTVTASDTVFADGFESGNLSAWSTSSGGSTRIGVSGAAALTGSYGMRAVINGKTPSYVQDDRPASQTSARTRFRFDPNGTTTNGLTTTALVGNSGNGTAVFRVEFRTVAGAPQVRGLVHRKGGDSTTAWYGVTDAPHTVEIAWTSSANASFTLYVDGVAKQTLTGLATGQWTLEQVRMGPSAGLAAGVTGTQFYDDYVMNRTTYVGP